MYGLPKNFDGSFLKGRVLELVCFSQNNLTLHFGAKIKIRIESAFAYKTELVIDVPTNESNLMELLGASVLSAHGDENGTLTLLFTDRQTLKVYDTSKQYESYVITYEGTEIIV